jgi:hypothetical protein
LSLRNPVSCAIPRRVNYNRRGVVLVSPREIRKFAISTTRKPPTRKADQQRIDERQKTTVLEAITAPLGFFVLALLIVETFLASVMIGTNLESSQKMVGMWAGIGLFVYVTLLVFE